MQELGYVERQNITFEARSGEGHNERLPALAAELVARPVDVIATVGITAARAAKNATATIPILVSMGTDPVAAGLVASLARPGGNVTGVVWLFEQLAGKRLEMLKETVPGLRRVAVLWDTANPDKERELEEVRSSARMVGAQVVPLGVEAPSDLDAAFALASREGADALMVLFDTFINDQRPRILALTLEHSFPSIEANREFAAAGGLMAYGGSLLAAHRRLGAYVDRVLKGARPVDLPVEQAREFEFVINLKTAQALGLTIPPHVLLQATEVIQ